MIDSKKFFEDNGYIFVKNFLDKNLCLLLYHYIQNEALRLSYLLENFEEKDFNGGINNNVYGKFNDSQALNDFSKYGDPVFDSILDLKTKEMCELTGYDLVANYTYHRLYTTHAELKKHKDRPSCEISTTICIGYNSNYNWPIFLGPKDGTEGTKGTSFVLEPGDMVIYKGCEIEHWREPFEGLNHAQLFMHYNRKDGLFDFNEDTDKYDGRPLLGLSDNFRNKNSKVIDLKLKKQKKSFEIKKTTKIID